MEYLCAQIEQPAFSISSRTANSKRFFTGKDGCLLTHPYGSVGFGRINIP